MAVERNSAIAVALLSDWLKNLVPVFQQMRSKTKTNHTLLQVNCCQVLGILIGSSCI